MPSVKPIYCFLLSGLVAYLLLYSFLLKKMPVVKIYFEDETQSIHELRRDTTSQERPQTELGGDVFTISTRHFHSKPTDHSARVSGKVTGELNVRARYLIMSFLDDLGGPVNRSLSYVEPATTQPPQITALGASLPELLRTLKHRFNSSMTPNNFCPTQHLREVGLLQVDDNPVELDHVERMLSMVSKGGHWNPTCQPRAKVAIVVPFRDRQSHLNIFLRHIHPFLQWQLLDYRIFVIEQAGGKPFNRGMLMNVGFKEVMKTNNFTCVVFHDVDLLPEDARNDYSCPSSPRHMSTAVNSMDYKLKYKTLFGGVEGFWGQHYVKVNGFPNRFWGWGGEDDDLYTRITERGLGLTRPAQMIGRYTMLRHAHYESDVNPERFDELRRSEISIDLDGLNSLAYRMVKYDELPVYTFISVDIG